MWFFKARDPLCLGTLPLHDALPIWKCLHPDPARRYQAAADLRDDLDRHRTDQPLRHARVPSVRERDRKSTRLNSSHRCISYAVFCLKKKKEKQARATTLKIE